MKNLLIASLLLLATALLFGCIDSGKQGLDESELDELESGLDEVDSLDDLYGEDVGVDSELTGEVTEEDLDGSISELEEIDVSVSEEYDSLEIDTTLSE